MFIEPFVAAMIPSLTKALLDGFLKRYESSEQEKVNYTKKLAEAEGDEVFKYLLLINVAAQESYTAQTRIQAQQSFIVTVIIAIAGFMLMAVGIVVGVASQLFLKTGLEIAYLTAIAGVLTQFVSSIFFYIYNKTLQQINLFHSELQDSQRVSMSLLLSSLVSDVNVQDAAKYDLAKLLLSRALRIQHTSQGKVTITEEQEREE